MIVRPATENDIDGMVALLQGHMNPKWTAKRWRRLFTYKWQAHRPDFGRVVDRDGEVVGCLAAVYSERVIEDRLERFCNPCAWYMRKDVRHEGAGLGLKMMQHLTADLTRHYVINTSSANTTNLLRRAGFVDLDVEKYVWTRDGAAPMRRQIEVISDPATIERLVDAAERRLIKDHAGLPVNPLLVRHADGQTLIMLADTIKGEGERWLDVLYASDPLCLAHRGAAVAGDLLNGSGEFLAADSRFCETPPLNAVRRPIAVPHFTKKTGLDPHHLDHLYSEIQLLELKLR